MFIREFTNFDEAKAFAMGAEITVKYDWDAFFGLIKIYVVSWRV